MGGGLMQLVAYGAQDIYLTGNPQITFFKVVYRRHTNFSMEAIEQTWNGSSTADGRCTATISRNGDLVSKMYIEIDNASSNCAADDAVSNPGAYFVNSVELEIGGQRIDKHTGHWMEVWAELTEENPSMTTATGAAVTTATLFQKMSGMGGVNENMTFNHIYIPLFFWFCRNPGLALPLIALQYHEVKVILDHNFTSMCGDGTVATINKLWCDYIYLDTDERRRFAQVSHEYLIEQLQYQTVSGATKDLNFNHPVKELIWTGAWPAAATNPSAASGVKVAASITSGGNFQLKLNGHDRFAARDFTYFTRVQVWEHHTGCGGLAGATNAGAGKGDDSIAVYSFALKPEEHQPSGTCNFSRIDNAQLTMDTAADLTIFAVNYNVLRIMSGMGGLAYSN